MSVLLGAYMTVEILRLNGYRCKTEQSSIHHPGSEFYLQVEELIKNRVQSFELHLRALTPGVREEVVRAELHYDKRIA